MPKKVKGQNTINLVKCILELFHQSKEHKRSRRALSTDQKIAIRKKFLLFVNHQKSRYYQGRRFNAISCSMMVQVLRNFKFRIKRWRYDRN